MIYGHYLTLSILNFPVARRVIVIQRIVEYTWRKVSLTLTLGKVKISRPTCFVLFWFFLMSKIKYEEIFWRWCRFLKAATWVAAGLERVNYLCLELLSPINQGKTSLLSTTRLDPNDAWQQPLICNMRNLLTWNSVIVYNPKVVYYDYHFPVIVSPLHSQPRLLNLILLNLMVRWPMGAAIVRPLNTKYRSLFGKVTKKSVNNITAI